MTRPHSLALYLFVGVAALAVGRLWPDASTTPDPLSPVALAQVALSQSSPPAQGPFATDSRAGGSSSGSLADDVSRPSDATSYTLQDQQQTRSAPEPFVPPDDWAGPAMGTGALGEFAATGLCAPALVTPEMLLWAFSPSQGEHQMTIEQTASGLRLGEYSIDVDQQTRRVTVSGPDGADALQRDVDRCVTASSTGIPATVGNWRWQDDLGWRYVDEPNPVYSEEVPTTP